MFFKDFNFGPENLKYLTIVLVTVWRWMPKAFEIYNCLNVFVNFLEKWESSPLSNLVCGLVGDPVVAVFWSMKTILQLKYCSDTNKTNIAQLDKTSDLIQYQDFGMNCCKMITWPNVTVFTCWIWSLNLVHKFRPTLSSNSLALENSCLDPSEKFSVTRTKLFM